MEPSDIDEIASLGLRAREASRIVAQSSSALRRRALHEAATAIEDARVAILAANEQDIKVGRDAGLTPAQIDRLTLTPARTEAMAAGLRSVATLRDVVGQVVSGERLANGLEVERVRVPLGVIGIIYENRPNVTADAAGLCVMAGNAVLLRGSSQAIRSNIAIAEALRSGIERAGLPKDVVQLVRDVTREGATMFMQLNGVIDCLIPRGGPSLLASIRAHATVPTVLDGDGNCHVYVDEAADLSMAAAIVTNAKLQRPGVCNAMETLLVHADVSKEFISQLPSILPDTEIRGDQTTVSLIPDAHEATDEDYATEFLDRILAVKVVKNLDEAIQHIQRFSSGHSEAIVTEHLPTAQRFVREVDAAAVLVNASTRFVDGGELGLGAEIGISTQKLHARGPMGLEALTCVKYVIIGNGQVRG
jgi:glutamate-5-semialdehyde dehydrogenase